MTLSDRFVRLEKFGDIAVIRIDNPPVNAASAEVRAGLAAALDVAARGSTVRAVVLAGASSTFVAGADIKEFGKPRAPPLLSDLCEAIEASEKPLVAAIYGNALGGGLELALAAHARIATADAMLGLPEVTLGIIPGAGGTQRLPRLCGLLPALEVIASGRRFTATEALRLGIIDAIAEGDMIEAAIARARGMIGNPLRRVGSLAVPPFDRAEARAALAAIIKKVRGQIAPARAAEVVIAGAGLSFPEAIELERATFQTLVASEQAAALRHVFFAERAARHVSGLDGAEPRKVEIIGVAGGGTMGSAIAVSLADAGYRVVLVEQNQPAAEAAEARVGAIIDRLLKSGRVDATGAAERKQRVQFENALAAFASCDLVIEAVFDDFETKKTLLRTVSETIAADAIVATNTSYLDPNILARSCRYPENLVGMHFFAPANVMALLEVIRTEATSPVALATALAVARRLKKLPIVSGVCEGFIGNRIYAVYREQCEFMLEEGCLPQEIDAALEGFGLPMGPFTAFDFSGLDIAWARRKRQAETRDPAQRYVAIPDMLCELGRLGPKSGAGWYNYASGKKDIDPVVTEIVERASRDKGIPRRPFTEQAIVDRVIAAMANEGARITAEKIAERWTDIDLVYVNGYGWPRWLGGPMFQGARRGAPALAAQLTEMARRDGARWAPSPVIVEAARSGRSLFEAFAAA